MATPGNEVHQWSIDYAVSFPIKYIKRPHFQSNVPSNQWYIACIFQIWLLPVGYEVLARGLEPIRNGKIF